MDKLNTILESAIRTCSNYSLEIAFASDENIIYLYSEGVDLFDQIILRLKNAIWAEEKISHKELYKWERKALGMFGTVGISDDVLEVIRDIKNAYYAA